MFESAQLEIKVLYQDEGRTIAKSCSIKYAGKPVTCTPSWDYENRSPSVIIREYLGVSAERFPQLRQQNPLLYWHEQIFIRIAYALSGVLAVIAIIWSWVKFPANIIFPVSNVQRFYLSLLISVLTWFVLTVGLRLVLGTLFLDGASWQLIRYLAFAGGIIAFIWQWYRLGGWHPNHILLHVLYSLSCGVLTFVAMYFFLMSELLLLGFID